MSTVQTKPTSDEPTTVRRNVPRAAAHRMSARDVVQVVYLIAAVLIVGFLGLMIFGVVINEITMPLWVFIAGFFAFRHGFLQYRNRLAVSGTATATASSAAIGLAELSGRGYVTDATEAPVSQTPSLFWQVELHQWGRHSKRRGWNCKFQKTSGQPDTLELEDETGRILVWTRGAELIPINQVWRSQDGNPPDAALRLVAQTGLQWPSPSSRYPMKITEERIEQGGPLYVMGTVAERRQIPARPTSFFAALLDRWGKTSPRLEDQSFSAALRFASHGLRRWLAKDFQSLCPPWLPPDVDQHQVLVWKGDQGRPFLVAGVLERETLTALSRRAWLYILGGAGTMAGTVLACSREPYSVNYHD